MWQWMRSTAWSSSCLRTQTKKRKTSGNSSENLKNTCNNFEVKWDPQAAKRRKVNLASLEAAVKTAADLQAAAAKAAEEAAGCRASNQSACDEEAQTSQQDPSCISFVFANITCWSAPAEKLILYQCHDYHVVPFAESRVLVNATRALFHSQLLRGEKFFFASASPSSKSVKGSHGCVLVAPRSSLQLGGMVANVGARKNRTKRP